MGMRAKGAPEALRQRLHEKGLKLTPQRYAIFELLANTESHPTVDEIYESVKKTFPMLSLNTVYYTLSALKEAGLISEVPVQHSAARFDANMDVHHHLVCLGCGKIKDLYDGQLDRLQLNVANRHGYDIRSHHVEFRGFCDECQGRKQRSAARVPRES
jgi:Fur family transcriptional regulator, peroxide stress response regulator